jgi:hypothetical protein
MLPFTDIFTSNPGKWFTTKSLKEELYRRLGYETSEAEFYREFLQFRDSFSLDGSQVVTFKMFKRWQYVFTNDAKLIYKHNAHLNRIKVRADKRKVEV